MDRRSRWPPLLGLALLVLVVVAVFGGPAGTNPATAQLSRAPVVAGGERSALVFSDVTALDPADGTVRQYPDRVASGEAIGVSEGIVSVAWWNDTRTGMVTALVVAASLAGLVAGGITLVVTRLLGYSWAPPRLIVARLLRRPYDDVGRSGAVAAHFALSILSLLVAGAVFLGGSILFPSPAGASILGSGPLYIAALLVLGGSVVWAAFAYRWLPAAADVVELPIGDRRRQAAIVGVLFTVIAAPIFAFLQFLAMMVRFF